MGVSTDYISLAELKNTAELVGFSFADYDATVAIAAACRGIDEYTGRFFYQDSSATVVRYYSPSGWCVNTDDFVEVTSVEADYNRDNVYETTWTAGTAFNVAPYNAPLNGYPYESLELLPWGIGYYLPRWPRSVKVTARYGWPETPAPIREATTILATRFLRRAREAPFGVVGLGVDNTAVRIAKTDPDLAFLLDPYVKGGGVMAA